MNCNPTKPQAAKAGQLFFSQQPRSLPCSVTGPASCSSDSQPCLDLPTSCHRLPGDAPRVGPDGDFFRLDSDLQPQLHHLCVPKQVLSPVWPEGSYFPCQPAVDMSRMTRGEVRSDRGGPEWGQHDQVLSFLYTQSGNLKPQQGLTPGNAGDAGFLPCGWERAAGNHRHGEMSPTGCEICKFKGSRWGRSEVSQSGDPVGGRTFYHPGPPGLKGLPGRRDPHPRKDEGEQHLSTLHLALGAEGAGNQAFSTH